MQRLTGRVQLMSPPVADAPDVNDGDDVATYSDLYKKCQVCLCDSSVLKVIACSSEPSPNDQSLDAGDVRHYICNECLEHMVTQWSHRDARHAATRASSGRLRCQVLECKGCFDDQHVAGHTTSEVFRMYVENRMRIASATTADECESKFKSRLNEHLTALDEAATVTRHINRLTAEVLEDIIATKCPKCHQHFDGFVGCFALECDGYVPGVGRVGCGAHWCAWCFTLFENEVAAHDHLLSNHCKEVVPVKRRSRQFRGRLYGSTIDFNNSVKVRPQTGRLCMRL